MKNYIELLEEILENGEERKDRTGVGTKSVFGPQLRFDLQEGFPAVTTKKLFFKGVVAELLWILKGKTNVKWLHEHGVHIWDEWAREDGELGPVYGSQIRDWGGVDQIKEVIDSIKKNPMSRRHVITTWNVSELDDMELPPCHGITIQFYVRGDEFLDCKMYQRSADMFLGVPFNIASYSILTHIVSHLTGYKPGHFIHTFGDAHIYNNHTDQVEEQITRRPLTKPQLDISIDFGDVDELEVEHISLENYKHHPAIKGPVAV